jgi:hypothetical protein
MEREWLQIKVIPVGDDTTPWLNDPEWCARLNTVLERLGEDQRRWVVGLLSLQLGRGGISRLTEITGIHNDTFTKARRELAAGLADSPSERIRREGGGRKDLTQTDPTLDADLEDLIRDEVAGDPCSGDRWVRQSLRPLAKALRKRGHAVSHVTVRELLKKKGLRCGPTANASPARPTPTATGNSATSPGSAKLS